jgi:hypothetical protein
MRAPKPHLITRREYKPILSDIERRAYAAAHRLCTENLDNNELVCPGGRRTARLDAIARVIMECYGESTSAAEGRASNEALTPSPVA